MNSQNTPRATVNNRWEKWELQKKHGPVPPVRKGYTSTVYSIIKETAAPVTIKGYQVLLCVSGMSHINATHGIIVATSHRLMT